MKCYPLSERKFPGFIFSLPFYADYQAENCEYLFLKDFQVWLEPVFVFCVCLNFGVSFKTFYANLSVLKDISDLEQKIHAITVRLDRMTTEFQQLQYHTSGNGKFSLLLNH